jgi:hypothetical protein
MKPTELSARFAAFTWYMDCRTTCESLQGEALQFAAQHWKAFLPVAHEGFGKLLLRVVRTRRRKPHGSRRMAKQPVAA